MEADEKLATALLPYLENFDENALSNLTERLKEYGIQVFAAAVTPGSNVGSSITFTKQECASPEGRAAETGPGNDRWDAFCDMLSAPSLDAVREIQAQGDSFDMFEAERLLGSVGAGEVGDGGTSDSMQTQATATTAATATATATAKEAREEMELYALLGEVPGETWFEVPWCGETAGSQSAACGETAVGWAGEVDTGLWTESRVSMVEMVEMVEAEAGGSESEAGGAVSAIWSGTDADETDATTSTDEDGRQAKRRRRSDPDAGSVSGSGPPCGEREREHEHATSAPVCTLRTHFGTGTPSNLADKVLADVWDLSTALIRPDLLDFLDEALPRWQTRGGLWQQEQLPELLMQGTGQARLFSAYSCICRLDARMGDDQIRNRVAVVMLHSAYDLACTELRHSGGGRGTRRRTAKGRGDASAVIDSILARLHDDWDHPDRKAQLRNRFHDKKRYGKRWLVLTRSLGPSLLFACSPRIASIVQNTAFTIDMLAALAYCVQHLQPKAVRILDVLNKSAPFILHAGRSNQIVPAAVLDELRPLMQAGT